MHLPVQLQHVTVLMAVQRGPRRMQNLLRQALMAAEEEVRARAASRKAKYSGPMLRYHSKKQGDTSVVRLRAFPPLA